MKKTDKSRDSSCRIHYVDLFSFSLVWLGNQSRFQSWNHTRNSLLTCLLLGTYLFPPGLPIHWASTWWKFERTGGHKRISVTLSCYSKAYKPCGARFMETSCWDFVSWLCHYTCQVIWSWPRIFTNVRPAGKYIQSFRWHTLQWWTLFTLFDLVLGPGMNIYKKIWFNEVRSV